VVPPNARGRALLRREREAVRERRGAQHWILDRLTAAAAPARPSPPPGRAAARTSPHGAR
jgi:hypothetical protein